MSSRPELVDNDVVLMQKKHMMFEERYITTKPKLIYRIEQQICAIKRMLETNHPDEETLSYMKVKVKYLEMLKEKVSETPLPEGLGNWWSYSFSIGSQRTVLYLNHHERVDIDGEEGNEYLSLGEHDAEFPIITLQTRLLSAEEYALEHNVASATIRVWIRRGKIRSAVKMGNAWMIPELAAPITKKYSHVSYQWTIPIEDAPPQFPWFSEPGRVSLNQDKENKQLFNVLHLVDGDNPAIGEFRMPGKDAEKLEAFLIASPFVTYEGDTYFYD